MKLVSIVVALISLLPASALGQSWPATIVDTVLRSTLPLTYENNNGGCTAFVIDVNRSYVLTAAHCDAEKLYVDQIPARVVMKDVKRDLLVLRVPGVGEGRVALKLASKDPAISEAVASVGYGYGLERPMFRLAHIADTKMTLPNLEGGPYIMLDAAVVPGQSGGPVVNSKGEVVMIVQRSSEVVGLGVGAETIQDKAGRYFAIDQK